MPPPLDQQYDGVRQFRKPVIVENQSDNDDFRNVYNANKGPTRRENYAQMESAQQITPLKQDGLVPPPLDQQYEGVP